MSTKSQVSIRDEITDDGGHDVAELVGRDELAKRVEAALKSTDISSAACRELIREVGEHRHRAETRWIAIKPGGAERLRVQTAGTLEAVEKIARASELLRFAIDAADAQLQALGVAASKAGAREASANLPAMHADLVAKLTRAGDIEGELAQLFRDIQAAIAAIGRARFAATRARLPAAAAEPETLNRIFDVTTRGEQIARQAFGLQRTRPDHAADLGIELGTDRDRAPVAA